MAASDSVPVAALRDKGADIVIAVNVMDVGRGAAGLYTPRFRIPMPGLVDNLLIGLDTVISQAAAQSCSIADIVVTPRQSGATWRDLLPRPSTRQPGPGPCGPSCLESVGFSARSRARKSGGCTSEHPRVLA